MGLWDTGVFAGPLAMTWIKVLTTSLKKVLIGDPRTLEAPLCGSLLAPRYRVGRCNARGRRTRARQIYAPLLFETFVYDELRQVCGPEALQAHCERGLHVVQRVPPRSRPSRARPSSSTKNWASSALPPSGPVGRRSGGSAAVDSDEVSSMTSISPWPSAAPATGCVWVWRNLLAGFVQIHADHDDL